MDTRFYEIPPIEGYYFFWERTVSGFSNVYIGQYFSYYDHKGEPYGKPQFQIASSEMDFDPTRMKNGTQGLGHDWYYGPLDIEIPELPK